MALLSRRDLFPAWSPLQELEEMSNRIDRLFGQMRGLGEESLAETTGWAPRVNVSETDDKYLITAELPAVSKDDVHVRMENGNLTIEGERKQREEEKRGRVHRVESYYGHFFRRFQMPEDADAKKIDAKFDNGMLEISIPKSEEKKAKKAKEIPIH